MSKSPYVLIFPKLRLFFNSLNGKIRLVIKVGLEVCFSHGGAHFKIRAHVNP